ncbi:NAD(P)-dependent oxidoreductase [Pigmentiphaga sp.]|uniref:NAD(P)-dependent oxidoreductase n=1 Tax=Pigmentiphaga sp. TaxID=1977564 RepID=UPI00128C5F9F|nr:NAD(P)-dependent oxidoreductase [Pigmentiphaga sp.]MPS28458.1 NAD(P)-dependent oxidoreductase [Alcaligenaceae bacterium SAGV5]MPS52123.1 NAD(P)-dependent oxidoreductase [Alcaligenaceae bacterium SAGV3]MPT56279.1 NAD(P)-dependent oxidoreductase [Alcaligenaceae bacterium]
MDTPRHFGFLGLGNMGLPMARRLLAAGHALTVWNRNADRAAELARAGARVAGTPAQVLAAADVLGICVKDGAAVDAVVFGPDGLAGAGPQGGRKIVVDFSTIEPEHARDVGRRLHERTGAAWLDAPVSGGVPGAEGGTLICFVGGEAADLEAARPFLAALTSRVTHMGPAGAGQTTKICNQMIVAVNVLAIAETYGLARRAGVDVERLAPALAGGFADSQPLQIFGPGMAAGRFAPTRTAVELMAKDIGISQRMAAELEADTPVSAFCSRLYESVREQAPEIFTGDVAGLVRRYA